MSARSAAATLYGLVWEARRQAYARGWKAPRRVPARVVSLGNLTAGGTGKTTLTIHLARRAIARGLDIAVVARRWSPGPDGFGDEERVLRAALGDARVRAGHSKLDLAAEAAREGAALVLVDDGFSHWPLARDVDVVLLDARDPWGGGRLLPEGLLREPKRALQRATAVVMTRLAPGDDPDAAIEAARPFAPAARFGAARHRPAGVRTLAGVTVTEAPRVRVVTATGNPEAVARTAREHGLDVAGLSAHPDHHWFTRAEIERERAAARDANARVLLTAKDAVRWPAGDGEALVLDVEWEWLRGGEAIESLVLEGEGA